MGQKDRCIDYIEFPARDLEAAKGFYGACFGWRFTDYGPDYCSFQDGQMSGGFMRADRSSNSQEGAALVVLYAEDLEGLQEKIAELGGQVLQDIYEFPGGRRFHFADPNGNELAVWSDR